MRERYDSTKVADIIAIVTYYQDLAGVDARDGRVAVWMRESAGRPFFGRGTREKRGQDEPGSPKVTTAPTLAMVAAGKSAAASCTTWAPWE